LRVVVAPALAVKGIVVRPNASTKSLQHNWVPGVVDFVCVTDVPCEDAAGPGAVDAALGAFVVEVDLAVVGPFELLPPPPFPLIPVAPCVALVVDVAD
jgi:hypothetical protein